MQALGLLSSGTLQQRIREFRIRRRIRLSKAKKIDVVEEALEVHTENRWRVRCLTPIIEQQPHHEKRMRLRR